MRALAPVLTGAVIAAVACQEPAQTHLQPDAVLQAALGLEATDRVHSIRITGGESERAEPPLLSIEPGSFVEFVPADWLVHEVVFETDSLTSEQRGFLERTDQVASPPLIERDSRYVLVFEGAPAGRYPYRLEGNGRTGWGAIMVAAPGPG